MTHSPLIPWWRSQWRDLVLLLVKRYSDWQCRYYYYWLLLIPAVILILCSVVVVTWLLCGGWYWWPSDLYYIQWPMWLFYWLMIVNDYIDVLWWLQAIIGNDDVVTVLIILLCEDSDIIDLMKPLVMILLYSNKWPLFPIITNDYLLVWYWLLFGVIQYWLLTYWRPIIASIQYSCCVT